MEKKLKINFILKGIAIFAFVAFCLLAILAGVTLPFVSNASTVDCAVVSAESDCATASADNTFNPLDYCVKLSDFDLTSTCYGFYFTEEFFNYVKSYSVTSDYEMNIVQFELNGSIYNLLVAKKEFLIVGLANYISVTNYFDSFTLIANDPFIYSQFNHYFIDFNGFTISIPGINNEFDVFKNYVYVFNQLPSGGDTTELENQIATLTDENNNLKNILGFKSRFGYIGDLKNNQMFLNLRAAPIIPDDIYCPYRNDTLVNYNKIGNNYYLSIVDAYDSNNNVVNDGFSGWKFINKKNPDGTPSSFYDFEFFIRDLRIAHIDTVEFVNNCFSTPNYNNINYLVSTNFLDANYAYGSDKSQYFYSLRSYLTKDDVRDFFALFDLTYYIPVNDAFYLDGYNNASKGYFDDGYKQGYDVGNTDGYNNGFSAGDSKGYQRGLNDANNYTFLSLFGAIFDVPIQALFGGTQRLPAGTKITDSSGKTITLTSDTIVNRGGMLNFDLMGVNLSGFVLALFSLSIIIIVIKFALAKK